MRAINIYIILFSITFSAFSQQAIIDSLNKELSNSKNDITSGILHIELARAYQKTDLLKTRLNALTALSLIGRFDTLSVDAYDQLGRYYFYSSKLDSALFYFGKARYILFANNKIGKVSSIDISIGSVLLRQGEYKKSSEVFFSSASYFEQNNDEGGAAKCYVNLATVFAELHDYNTSIAYSHKALSILRPLNMTQIEMIVLPNLATQYARNNDKINAFKYYKEAEELALTHDNTRSLAIIYNNLGDLYLSEKSYDEAEKYIMEAINLKKALKQQKGLEESYFNMGFIKYKNKKYSEALEYYKWVQTRTQGIGKIQVLRALKELHQDMGDLEKAIYYADQAQVLSDSVKQEESKKIISELSTKYNTTQRENNILQLTQENQSLELAKFRNQIWLVLLWVALIATSLFSYLLYKNVKKKRLIVSQKHQLEQQKMLEQFNKFENETIEKMILGQEEERMRIARDLHDSLGSKLSTLKRYIENISTKSDKESNTVQAALTLADSSYTEVRNIAHEINSGVLLDQGFIPALKNMVNNISLVNQLKINVITTDLTDRLANNVEIQLFRIVQELITNVIKHASATEINLQVTSYEDHLNLIVEDNGDGFDIKKVKMGFGLKNIEKRLGLLGGQYEIDSSPVAGTTVILNLPI
ncbi:MAG: sensor histidine kinase [Saprospiraceae bacterium]